MNLPNQARPVERTICVAQDGPERQASGAMSSTAWSQDSGVEPSGYEQCYTLPGPAQRTCLLMATD